MFKYMSKRYQDPLTEIRKPALRAPADSCDCHAHMFGPLTEYPVIADARFSNPRVGADDYRKIAGCLGIARTVIVQPHVYGADNRCAWDILEQQQGKWRGIAVLDLRENERTLTAMHVAGFRGVRVNLRNKGGLTMHALAEVAACNKPYGWHIEFAPDGDDLITIAQNARGIAVDIAIPHMGRVAARDGIASKPFQALLELVKQGRCWVKLSAPHRISSLPYPHQDVLPFARALIEAAPERMLWATDWPHTGVADQDYMPNDGDTLDQLACWTDDPRMQRRILVENPAKLYGY